MGAFSFLEAGKKRPAGYTTRAATSTAVEDLRHEARDLKEVEAEQERRRDNQSSGPTCQARSLRRWSTTKAFAPLKLKDPAEIVCTQLHQVPDPTCVRKPSCETGSQFGLSPPMRVRTSAADAETSRPVKKPDYAISTKSDLSTVYPRLCG